MKKISLFFILCLYCLASPAQQKEFTYQNPIRDGIDMNGIRDCQVFANNGYWYMTGTAYPFWEQQEINGLLNPGIPIYRSEDLTHWTFINYLIERPTPDKWYYHRFWAPEIHRIKGKYYLTFNCSNAEAGYEGQYMGYAVADNVEGPYRIVTEDKPLARGNDLTLFEDEDGSACGFWCGKNREFGIGYAKIDLENGRLLTEPQTVIRPGEADFSNPDSPQYKEWDSKGIEGPYVIKRSGKYYLFYSSWTRGYEVGYAVAETIEGPWHKNPGNPFYGAQDPDYCHRNGFEYTQTDTFFTQVGHNAVFKGPDGREWLSCHGITSDNPAPALVIDPIEFDETGNIMKTTPSCEKQVLDIVFHKPDSPYILTPKAKASPRINCAKKYGARPNAEFRFYVSTSGIRPMSFKAEGLPPGLTLDPDKGIITGSVSQKGRYDVTVTATNKEGSYQKGIQIVVGDEIALTPPMGWSSWNCWGNTVSQEKILEAAKAICEKGLADYGWTYINIDDGWQGIRGGKYNAIMPNKKFPNMAKLVEEIHDLGLKVGIYSSPWNGTYAGHIGCHGENEDGTYDWIKEGKTNEYYRVEEPNNRTLWNFGKYSFVENDVTQWSEWGIDYLKYDWDPNDVWHMKEMYNAIQQSGRDIVYSISNSAPYADAPKWAKYTNCWRTTGDIEDTWESISRIGFNQDKWAPFKKPGHWSDPDMLVVGRVGWGDRLHPTRLTADEQYTHISLWALLAAPLIVGCDINQIDDFTLNLLCNHEVNEVNQDILGYQGFQLQSDSISSVIAKPLEGGAMAVGLFNKSDTSREVSVTFRQLGLRGKQQVRDLWRQKDLGEKQLMRFPLKSIRMGSDWLKFIRGTTDVKESLAGTKRNSV